MQGTISIILGCHSVFHSILVLIAWIKLYGCFPKFWQLVCILIHDLGHWGKNYLDDVDAKQEHWKLGASVAGRLFGNKGFTFCAGHNYYSGYDLSLLYKPDKYSWHIAPWWWLYSNTIFEPKLAMGYTRSKAISKFKEAVKDSIESGEYRPSHDMYLERCNSQTKERPKKELLDD